MDRTRHGHTETEAEARRIHAESVPEKPSRSTPENLPYPILARSVLCLVLSVYRVLFYFVRFTVLSLAYCNYTCVFEFFVRINLSPSSEPPSHPGKTVASLKNASGRPK